MVELGTDTDLHRASGIDQAFVRRMEEHGAVIVLAAVGIGVGMGIKVHQCQFAEMFGVCAQQRQSHEVVAAEGEHALAGFQQFFRVRLQLVAHVLSIAEVEHHVAAIDDIQTIAQVKVPRPAVAFPSQVGGNLTDCRRTVTATGAAGGCHVKWNAGDDPLCIAVVRHKVQRKAQETKGIGH
ncbi:hypothetical protein D3C72_1405130 [compost metagenome]